MFLLKPMLAFRPVKSDWIFAVKTFLAGVLALYIAFRLELPYPIWAIGTVFVIANPFAGMTISKSIFRVLGTFLGAAVALLVTPVLIQYPVLFTLFLACWVGLCLYISLLDRTPRSYAFLLAGYTSVIIGYNCIYFIDTVSVFDMAIGRFLEITLGVVCSGIVSAIFFPQSIGHVLNQRVQKTVSDSKKTFFSILKQEHDIENHTQRLSHISRDISDLHVMVIHLIYEKSILSGMTKPLQEMMHQLSIFVSNLVAMSERIQQLQHDPQLAAQLLKLQQHIEAYTQQPIQFPQASVFKLPEILETDFEALFDQANAHQQIILMSLKMDVRHALQNLVNVACIWKNVQQGQTQLPEHISSFAGKYPLLHRDHGVAVRGGISAFLIVLIATGLWIISGWTAAFMMAEMAAISACILTAMDNPVPALRFFIRGNIYAGIMIFIYAFGIFPMVTEFWQLIAVLAPFVLYCLMLFPHPPLTGLALPLLMGTIMGLNFQNNYHLDPVFFFDATIGTIIGPIISILIIHLVRAMSPDITVHRILASHNQLLRKVMYLPYGAQFQMYLRQMFDQIGVLNTKAVSSPSMLTKIDLALIEVSTAVDLSRLYELLQNPNLQRQQVHFMQDGEHDDQRIQLKQQLQGLQQLLDQYLDQRLTDHAAVSREQIIAHIDAMHDQVSQQVSLGLEWAVRVAMTLNNIRSSLCHAQRFANGQRA